MEALKEGAFDYVTKPVDPDELSNLVRNALRQQELTEENLRLKERVSEMNLPSPIVGESLGMRRIMEMIRTVAETDSTVVILGESGTGKEIIARAIHAQSKRRFAPIVAVNCGAIAETLLESELFGHEKGSFTGAQYRRKGRIELAHGGTLFLDEIGDISQKMQISLLRVIETRSFTRLGGNKEIKSDFRLVCATNRNLEQRVAEGDFREDLYYRIKVFSIEIPPLRERHEDILPLARHFVTKYARSMGKAEKPITPKAQEVLEGYRWPGNVRELENAIERAMVIGKDPEIQPKDLPLQIEENGITPVSFSLGAMEKDHIIRVMGEMDGIYPHAIRLLKEEVDLRPAYSPERNQYHATLILASLLRNLPDPSSKILGITSVDLFVPVLTFVFGQAQLDGPGALLSTFRLRNAFYGLPPNEDLLLDRTLKESVHELGHTFGLVHCSDAECVMSSSTYVEEVDLKADWYCPQCEQELVGF